MKLHSLYRDSLVKESAPRTNILNMAEFPHIKDSDLFKVLRHLPPLGIYGPWVAGGSVWRTINKEPLEKCDIDVFFQNQKQYEETVLKMNSLPTVNNIVKETKNKWNTIYKFHVHERKAFEKTIDVQFINMNFHQSLDSLLESFDLTVCQFGYDGENLHCGLTSLDDLSAKRIRLHSLRLPKTMFKHLHKYLNNGFTISSDMTRELAYRMMTMNCWKSSNQPDYDDDDGKKDPEAKYASPFSGQQWEGYGYTTTSISTSPGVDAPIVEAEDEEEVDTEPFVARPQTRRANRGERIENGGRRNRRVAPDAAPLQANTGWVQPAGNANAVWGYAQAAEQGVAQWAPINPAPQPAAPANQNPVAEVPIAHQEFVELRPEPGAYIVPANPQPGALPMPEPAGHVFYAGPQPAEIDNDWENYGYAPMARAERRLEELRNNVQPPVVQPGYNVPPPDQNQGRIMEQLEREGFLNVPDGPGRQQHIDAAVHRARDLMRAHEGREDVRQQAYRNAADELNQAYENMRRGHVVNEEQVRVVENEIADRAAQRANDIEHGFEEPF